MLAYSGKGKFVVEPVDLSRIVEESGKILAMSVSKKATVTYNLATDLPAVQADAAQICQVLMNLVINASEALGEHAGDHGVDQREPARGRRLGPHGHRRRTCRKGFTFAWKLPIRASA